VVWKEWGSPSAAVQRLPLPSGLVTEMGPDGLRWGRGGLHACVLCSHGVGVTPAKSTKQHTTAVFWTTSHTLSSAGNDSLGSQVSNKQSCVSFRSHVLPLMCVAPSSQTPSFYSFSSSTTIWIKATRGAGGEEQVSLGTASSLDVGDLGNAQAAHMLASASFSSTRRPVFPYWGNTLLHQEL
jgi:hypothetical protein